MSYKVHVGHKMCYMCKYELSGLGLVLAGFLPGGKEALSVIFGAEQLAVE